MTSKISSAVLVLAFASSGITLGLGCKKDPEPNTAANATATWGYGPNGGVPPATTTPTGTMPPGTTAAPGTVVPPATTTAPPPATTTAPPAASTVDATVLQPLLTPLAAQHAKGAKPEGGTLGGMLQTGQSMQAPAQLAPNGTKCYTAIAVGVPSVTEITVELVTNMPPLPPTTLSTSQGSPTTMNPSVMAGSPNCFKNIAPLPVMVNLKVTAKGGSGAVLAQLYAK